MNTHYKELCLAAPAWIKHRVVSRETVIDLKKPAYSSATVLKLLDAYFHGVPKLVYSSTRASKIEQT
jgi:hypothetical protein